MEDIAVSVILINYNTLSFTEQCIKSIATNTKINYEIIVVENNSSDKDKIARLEEQYNFVKVIISKTNLGFGGGNNLGVRNASGKYILILNNDTIVYPDTIDNIKKILDESDNKTIITGFIEGSNGSIQPSGGEEPRILAEIMRFGFFLIKHVSNPYYDGYYFFPKENEKLRNVDWAPGCFFAMTKKFYKDLNGFDEKMFMYVEDVEFHKRARLKGGKIIFCPDIRIKHFGMQTSKNYESVILKSEYKNTVYYFKKHSSIFSSVLFYFVSKSIFIIWYLLFGLGSILPSQYKIKIQSKRDIFKTLFLA
ncbi:MAG: glycosyltransferase [Candidatus Thorarchaeota archaeon]